jgi:hypothetical protein
MVSAGALLAAVPATAAVAHGSPPRDGGGYGDPHKGSVRPIVDGLKGPRGLAAADGKLVVTEVDGTFSVVKTWDRHGRKHQKVKVFKLGQLKTDFSPAVDVGRDGTLWLLTGGSDTGAAGSATLYKWRWGDKSPKPVADIAAYQKTDPDPNDLEGNPTDSNPFGVAALDDGSVLVADAGGNDLLRVVPGYPKSTITTVARLKPRIVKVPKGLPKEIPGEGGGPSIKVPKAGTKVPAEAVATSVTVGKDGAWYVGELRGFPATPGTSEIWRIEPGTTGATCDPQKPWGSCKRFADGLTSIMDLAAGWHGLYAVEMSRKSWLQAELQIPGAQFGTVIKVDPKRHGNDGYGDAGRRGRDHRNDGLTDLTRNELVLPGGVAVGERGDVFVTGPVLPDAGPGSIWKLDTRSRGDYRH